MKNDFDDGAIRISIPPTLLISAIGKVPDIEQVVTMEFKASGDHIFLVSAGALGLAATTYAESMQWTSSILPELNLVGAAAAYQIIFAAMQKNLVQSCHDLSEGGLAVAVSECIIGSGLGADLNAEAIVTAAESGARFHDLLRERLDFALFGEGPARMLITVSPKNLAAWQSLWQANNSLGVSEISVIEIGKVTGFGVLKLLQSKKKNEIINLGVITLKQAWQATLPFEEDFHE